MKKILFFALALVVIASTVGCNKSETYAEKRKKEKNAISKFISDSSITVISEEQFRNQDSTTNVAKNEYVLFSSTGVYMQIISKGCGRKIAKGESATILARYYEYNILNDTIQAENWTISNGLYPEHMYVINSSGTFTGVFDPDYSTMYYAYSSTAVPSGWLVPLNFVKIGRQSTPDESIAHVKLIVPGAEGQADASSSVYPCFYEITYERQR